MAILPNLQQQFEASQAALAAANAKLAALETAGQGRITPKVSRKGAVSLYGFGRYPVTLYAEQVERLFAVKGEIEAWIKTNPSSRYNDKGERVAEGGTEVHLVRKG